MRSLYRKLKKVHGDKYDYSLVDYVNYNTKVKIICSKHGVFLKSPKMHLDGNGCNECYNFKRKYLKEENKRFLGKDGFIQKAKKVHGDKYDYSLVEYNNNRTYVSIICPIHGKFVQKALKHLQGHRCPKCYGTHLYSTEEFVEKAKKVHGDKYDYSLVDYKGALIKVKIICNNCKNIFEQRPTGHINLYYGCPVCCTYSKGEEKIEKILMEKNINYIREYRIKECRNKLPLPFDFYIPEKRLMIEYQGIQHFKSIKHFKGDAGYNIRIINDKIKENYCKNNNFLLLKINYNENIEEVLKNKIDS